MNDSKTKILIVEDEMIIGAKISMQLINLGYEVTGLLAKGEEALVHIKSTKPDIILLDIQLKGDLDGIETAQLMQQEYDIPIIYLTANADEANFNKAKSTRPYAFISKPFKRLDLQRAMELTIARMEYEKREINEYVDIPHQNSENDQWLSTLEITVRNNIGGQNLTVDYLADLIHISRAQLFRRVHALTGLTPLQYIHEIRYNYSRALLEQRRYNSVKAVAAAVGVSKVQYFSEQFKERFGKSPSEFLG